MGIYEHGNADDVSLVAFNANYQTPWPYICFITLENVHSLH
jgi:hypothetical protein